MTSQCKYVLRSLKELTGNTDALFRYSLAGEYFQLWDDSSRTFDYSKYSQEIDSIMIMLADEGYILQTPSLHALRLSQKAIHKKQITFKGFLTYIVNNWIAILALIVSIIALISSWR